MVACVDWCDARAYCVWAGKRLCSGVGGSVTLDATIATERDPTRTEWQYACTDGGKHTYPYGDAYVPGKCVDPNTPSLLATRTGSPTCIGDSSPYSEIRDLVGNVFEWGADCDAAGDNCEMFGGYNDGSHESCAATSGRTVNRTTSVDIGFRCCADAIAP